ncbi:MAG: hypothetical protein WCW13_03865 [archaeon]|jgi:hypothetical protein
MKGYLFSTEVLFTMAIVILATSTLWYSSTLTQQNTSFLELQNQSAASEALYFNLNPSPGDNSATTQYCTTITTYSNETKQLFTKLNCRWVK